MPDSRSRASLRCITPADQYLRGERRLCVVGFRFAVVISCLGAIDVSPGLTSTHSRCPATGFDRGAAEATPATALNCARRLFALGHLFRDQLLLRELADGRLGQ